MRFDQVVKQPSPPLEPQRSSFTHTLIGSRGPHELGSTAPEPSNELIHGKAADQYPDELACQAGKSKHFQGVGFGEICTWHSQTIQGVSRMPRRHIYGCYFGKGITSQTRPRQTLNEPRYFCMGIDNLNS